MRGLIRRAERGVEWEKGDVPKRSFAGHPSAFAKAMARQVRLCSRLWRDRPAGARQKRGDYLGGSIPRALPGAIMFRTDGADEEVTMDAGDLGKSVCAALTALEYCREHDLGRWPRLSCCGSSACSAKGFLQNRRPGIDEALSLSQRVCERSRGNGTPPLPVPLPHCMAERGPETPG